MSFLTVTHLSRQEKENLVVNNISFEQEAFQKIAIAGATGSGKTSLLKMVAGLMQPTSGEIYFHNEKVIGPLDQLIPHHPGIAYLSQHFELFNNYWVHEILEMANQLPEEEANRIYAICRIGHLLTRRTNELSGGEKQRIALARLLSTSPKLLLLDEPFSNLDAVHKGIIKSVIHDISEQLGITCTMVSHDALDILSWADTIMVMQEGNIIQWGTPEQVYRQPINGYCAGLLGQYNLMEATAGSTLAALAAIELDGRNAVVRPEEFSIDNGSRNAVQGSIKNISFWGSYYMLDVLVGGQAIQVKIDRNIYVIGQIVHLSLKVGPLWFI